MRQAKPLIQSLAFAMAAGAIAAATPALAQ